MKIIFFIDSLHGGGAAKVVAVISDELVRRGHKIFIATNTTHRKINYEINKEISVLSIYSLNHYNHSIIWKLFSLAKKSRKILKEIAPDIIIGVMSPMFLISRLASLGLSTPIIASDHTAFSRKLPWLVQLVRFYFYNLADAVTVLTQVDYDFLGKRLPKKTVIPNPISYPVFNKPILRRKNILAIGRLYVWKVKGFDILIEVWGRIAAKYPDWILEIAGTGDDFSIQELKSMTKKFNVENRVNFLGFHSDIDKIMQESSIFVLSSRVEGLPLVLLDAMSQGCACICFDTDGRQKEIISTVKSGIIVENQNKDELEKSLVQLIEDDELRNSLSEGAILDVLRFSKETITDKWEALFNQIQK